MKDNTGDSDIAPAILTLVTRFNPLKPNGYFMCHKV
jgi:hypothetical protein